MTTSSENLPRHFTAIDDLTRRDHYHLTDADRCFFLGEYTSGAGFGHTNSLIGNFKKPVDRRGRPEWHYKEQAIARVAMGFRVAFPEHALERLTLVPIPPSKARGHPLYDDRMVQMLRRIRAYPPLDVRELIVQTRSMQAAHEGSERPSPQDLEAAYELEPALLTPAPQLLVVVDDMLTTGDQDPGTERWRFWYEPAAPPSASLRAPHEGCRHRHRARFALGEASGCAGRPWRVSAAAVAVRPPRWLKRSATPSRGRVHPPRMLGLQGYPRVTEAAEEGWLGPRDPVLL